MNLDEPVSLAVLNLFLAVSYKTFRCSSTICKRNEAIGRHPLIQLHLLALTNPQSLLSKDFDFVVVGGGEKFQALYFKSCKQSVLHSFNAILCCLPLFGNNRVHTKTSRGNRSTSSRNETSVDAEWLFGSSLFSTIRIAILPYLFSGEKRTPISHP